MQSKLTSVEQIDLFTGEIVHYLEQRELDADRDYQRWSAEISEENDRAQEQWQATHCEDCGLELGTNGLCGSCLEGERVSDL